MLPSEGFRKLLQQDLPWMDRPHSIFHHDTSPSVIVHDFHVARPILFPDKTDPPLVIDPDAVLLCPIPF
jgi:hypothetical protein